MKKRLLIICSIIGVLLAGFQFPIYAEETVPDYSSSTSIITSAALDQYFTDNYDLLPYIHADGNQFINTGIPASNNLKITVKASNFDAYNDQYNFLYGDHPSLALGYKMESDSIRYYFNNNQKFYNTDLYKYYILNSVFDKNKLYINSVLVHTFDDESFTGNGITIFNSTGNVSDFSASCDLYNFSIYDYSANDGNGALIRDYYPARSKASGTIGLYDSVTKTFITTSSSVPFEYPSGSSINLSIGSNITQFLSGSLSWIGAIFKGINEMPIIWVFIAIALVGVMFRWARRIVHF